ncbi:TonB-dependent copper receptor [Kerstersia gyiorum]|uniref:TonB-dependent copper receptor n=2 Tax=Kerstersia gyiorum TaxID=206506 RepID=UPI002A223EF3|nr:iron complex outermembrane receptor protein [Kerstersia gyiorum]MCP1671691.1 iron complex outermembrane receptor protein [Kerstersia gyiorum]MCP1709664.1 iron complex outermembrane receptor protein [Kerstersia gyiorum]MCP1713172.1 iron complex outermembrane receptor protein [Kerstersia gyiorum]
MSAMIRAQAQLSTFSVSSSGAAQAARRGQAGLALHVLCAALAAALPMVAQADKVADGGRLAPVVITALPPSSPLVIETDPKIPRQPLPAADGADYLKTIPGFTAVRSGGANADPVLRGMFGSRLNILVDDTTMLGACPSRMDTPVSYIAPENFDELVVVKGPQTVLWGPGASAGTVRFERSKPVFTEEDAPVRFEGSVVGGSWGRNDQNADLIAGNEHIYARVAANHSHSQNYKDGNGDEVPSRWDKWNVDLAVGLTPDTDTLYELTAGVGDGEARSAGRGMDGTRFKRESIGFRFEKENITPWLEKVEARVYHNYADHVMDNYKLRDPDPASSMPMAMASNVDRTTNGGRVAGTFRLAETVKLTSGLDARHDTHRARSAMAMGGGGHGGMGGHGSSMGSMSGMGGMSVDYQSKPRVKDAAFDNIGVFGELRWELADERRVITGLRIDRAEVKDYRTTSPTYGDKRSKTLPSAFARYEADLSSLPVSWYVGLGHVQRMPDYWELFSPTMGPAGSVNAFSAIKPEKTTQLDVGADYHGDNFDAWISAYAGHVTDYILFDYNVHAMGGGHGAASRAENINARTLGGELGAGYNWTSAWRTEASLAYAWGRMSGGGALPQQPPLEVRLSASYDDGTWSFGALWRLVASQNRYSDGLGNVASKDFGATPGYGVLSLNGGYAIDKRWQLNVGIDNLLDKTYHEHLNMAGNGAWGYSGTTAINEPGRTVWARLGMKF